MVLVLNADYTPLTVTNIVKGFNLVYKNKAEIVLAEDKPIIGDKEYLRPSVLRLVKYVHFPYKRVALSRDNLFKRDNYTCLYCGSKNDLTLDHVIPRCKGGTDSWTNLATCCMKCNVKKGSKSLEEINMKLSEKPFVPNHLFFIKKMTKFTDNWEPYLKTGR
jgi:hypothetical protein